MVQASSFNSIPALYFGLVEKRSDITLFTKRQGKKYHSYTWRESGEKVKRVAAGLIRSGLEPGDRVALMADNGPNYAFCDLAIQAAGCTVVPIYTTLAANEILHILENSETKLIIVGVTAAVPRVEEAMASMDAPPDWLLISKAEAAEIEGAKRLSAFLKKAMDEDEVQAIAERTTNLKKDDLSCIIYTSGTTGPPKGVMLSHGNLIANVEASLEAIPLAEGHLVLSFLPLSHTFERSMGFYAAMTIGASIHYARSLATVAQDFAECSPSVAMCVPRFLEKLHDKAMTAMNSAKPMARKIALTALSLRKEEVRRRREGRRVPLWMRALSNPSLRVLKPIRDKLGGRLYFLVSGGAALAVTLWDFFEAVGITVIQGYGLTETSPVISVNRLDNNRPASVGLPLCNLQVRLGKDDEVEVAGPSIMKGYWKNEKATNEVIEEGGWFKTGDIGSIDDAGFLYITDRKKDIIVNASGKNIAPQNIESALCLNTLVEFACVLGEGRNILGVLISPCMEVLESFAEDRGIATTELAKLREEPTVVSAFQEIVDKVNGNLASYERIARFRITCAPFTREGGELTPTMKVRRKEIMKLRADEIDALFDTDSK